MEEGSSRRYWQRDMKYTSQSKSQPAGLNASRTSIKDAGWLGTGTLVTR